MVISLTTSGENLSGAKYSDDKAADFLLYVYVEGIVFFYIFVSEWWCEYPGETISIIMFCLVINDGPPHRQLVHFLALE